MPRTGAAIVGGCVGTYASWYCYINGMIVDAPKFVGFANGKLTAPVRGAVMGSAAIGALGMYTVARMAYGPAPKQPEI